VRATGSAERLQRAQGAWRLEFQQLVYNTPTMLRPRRFSVLGEPAILAQLRELTGHEPLARDAERLFARGALPDGTYVVRDGRWLPEVRPETVATPEPDPAAAASAAEGGGGGMPRALVEELVKRILSLESTVRNMQDSLDTALKALSQAAMAQVIAGVQPSAAGAGSPTPTQVAAAATSPAIIPVPIPIPPAAATGGSDRKVIALPPINALTDLIKGLAGPEASISQSERVDWASVSATQPVFFAVVQDHGGDEAGSMIFDLESALRLAGALLMESDEMIESLLEEKVMSDEMLDAASEVCNTLTSAFNKVSGNPHLRAGKMQPFTEARSAQLASVRSRDDYRYNQGGRLSLVAR
jgi:hypothetical protein